MEASLHEQVQSTAWAILDQNFDRFAFPLECIEPLIGELMRIDIRSYTRNSMGHWEVGFSEIQLARGGVGRHTMSVSVVLAVAI